jgi:putative nucleotidyltransferase with HDIG domain
VITNCQYVEYFSFFLKYLYHWRTPVIDRPKDQADLIANAEALISHFEEFKTIPQIAMRVCHLIAREDSTIREIEEVLRLDPILVSRLLRMANSAYYGVRCRVESVAKAVVFIGLKNLRNLVVIDTMKDCFLREPAGLAFSHKRLWMHCTAVGVCAQMISRRLLGTTGEDAFLAGILHDIGMMVEDQAQTTAFQAVMQRYRDGAQPILEEEHAVLGTDHCVVGGLLARRWKFPDDVQTAIREHHVLRTHDAELMRLPAIVQVAHYLADISGYREIPERMENPKGILADHIRKRAAEYRILARDFAEEMKKASSFYEVDAA